MDVFSLITLLGGLAFFLYGMHVMSSGLEKMAGGKLEGILKKITATPLKALALGIGITATIQSSSAVTVMLVGLVNSGIMELPQTVGVIMGSNIGTTATAWILSLVGIESDNFFVKLLKPETFSLLLALLGIILVMFSNQTKKKDIGTIFLGFAVLMFGMKLMSSAVTPLADSPQFASVLTAFNNPLIGVLVGAAFTAVIQSSSASVGILQALAMTGCISYGMAIPIIMGQNIGTCVTALISSINVNANAKRVSIVHISFNVLGTVICMSLFYLANSIFEFAFLPTTIGVVGIAMCHSIFNIITTIILLPFSKKLVALAEIIVRSKSPKGMEAYAFLDDRLLKIPSVAIAECNNMAYKMADITKDTVISAMSLIEHYDIKIVEKVIINEGILDTYEDKLGTYLVKLANKDMSDNDSKIISKLLHTIGDFERLGDHSLNLTHSAQEINEKKIKFSAAATRELGVIGNALREITDITFNAFATDDLIKARIVEPLEQVVDTLAADIKNNHINRLQDGTCTIQMGFVLSDLLTNFKRISDHCSNIAVALIELEQNSFGTHEYLHAVKSAESGEFSDLFEEYLLKYDLTAKKNS